MLSSLTILGLIKLPAIENVHLRMIVQNEKNEIFRRYFAYWIMTHGFMRLSNDVGVVKASYILEAMCIANELDLGEINNVKAVFVIASSLLLAYYI
jgi:hypothetical protein